MTDTINYLRRCADNRALEASLTPEMCRGLVQMIDHLEAERDTVRAEWQASERRALEYGDIVARHVAVMRAAVLAGDDCMRWIINTLAGPGHLPDGLVEHADAQAMFDAEVAEIDAHRAKHPIPEPVVGPLRRKAAEMQKERDAALAELAQAREVLREARDAVEGRTAHLYRGDCPSPRNWLDRDPECPACATLIRIDAALASKGE